VIIYEAPPNAPYVALQSRWDVKMEETLDSRAETASNFWCLSIEFWKEHLITYWTRKKLIVRITEGHVVKEENEWRKLENYNVSGLNE
jgi:hypothetical protein